MGFLLHAAELLSGDPQVDDYGPLYVSLVRDVASGATGVDLIGRQLRAWTGS